MPIELHACRQRIGQHQRHCGGRTPPSRDSRRLQRFGHLEGAGARASGFGLLCTLVVLANQVAAAQAHSGRPPAGHCAAGKGVPPCRADPPAQWPAVDRLRHLGNVPDACDLGAPWLLPGACAKGRAGKPRNRPAPPVGRTGQRTHPIRHSLRIGRRPASASNDPPASQHASARRPAVRVVPSDNKDSVGPPAGGSRSKTARKHPSQADRKKPAVQDDHEPGTRPIAEVALQRPDGKAPEDPAHAHGNAAGTGGNGEGEAASVLAPAFPACLHFHETAEALHQVRRAPLSPAAPPVLRFCVPAAADHVLQRLFDRDDLGGAAPALALRAYPLREALPPLLRQARIRKYSGLGQIERQDARDAVPLGDDHVFAMATLSVVPDAQLQAHAIGAAQILPRNSFRLLQHTDLGGEKQLFLVYFLHADHDARAPGIQLGLLPIEVGPERYRLHDTENGIELFSDTLDDFVAGLETLSGCTFRPDEQSLPYVHRPERGDLPLSTQHHFFVREEAARASLPPHDVLRPNPALRFIDAIPYSARNGRLHGVLHRNCFVRIGRTFVFADAQGRLGTLRLGTEQQAPGHYALLPHGGIEAEFMRDFGLRQGEVYSPAELAEILQNFGAHLMPTQPQGVRPAASRLDAFYLRTATPAAAATAARDTQAAADDRAAPCTFWFQGATLHYVDPHGHAGQLGFQPSGDASRPLILAGGLPYAELAFVWSNDLDTLQPYTQEEIKWKLHGAGYIHDSRRDDVAAARPRPGACGAAGGEAASVTAVA